ncbi:MAG: protein translocase subunit SecD, partial [Opitutales bacterium]
MSSRPLWKVVLSLLVLAAAVYELTPLRTVPLEVYAPAHVRPDATETFAKLHAEAQQRVKSAKDATVPDDRKSPTYYQALRDIGAGRGRAEPVDLLPIFFDPQTFVREPELLKRNTLVLKELLRRSQGRLKLGLDLQGGVSFTLKVDTETAVADATKALEEAKAQLEARTATNDAAGIAEAKVRVERAERTLAERSDRGGAGLIDQAAQVMDKRINAYGVAEPVIRPVGADLLEIQLPGEDAANNPDIIDVLKKPAKLEFRQVYRYARPTESELDHTFRSLPDNPRAVDSPVALYEALTQRDIDRRTGQVTLSRYFVRKRADATGAIISRAGYSMPDGFNWQVDMAFTSDGAERFGELTTKIARGNLDGTRGQLAIVLDGELQSAPSVDKPILGNGAMISGSFTPEEAKQLADVLNNPLEFPLRTQDVTAVGPSLAQDAQDKSVVASTVAVGLVILFMVGFYLWGGFIAVVGMVVNLVMMLGAMAYFGATITLPGVAALVLTLGMAVDANILIFERVREELRLGKDPAVSLREGYDRAMLTIVDANLTHLLVALILANMGTGPIKGFGVTLIIGIFTTLLSTLITCRGLQEFSINRGVMTRLFGLPVFRHDIGYQFLRYARPALIVSWSIVALGMFALYERGESAFGKDFRGGESTLVAIRDAKSIDTGKVQALAASLGLPDTTATLQTPVGGGEPTLRIETSITEDKAKGDFANITAIVGALKAQHPGYLRDASLPVEQLMLTREAVGASVSGDLRQNAVISVIFALLGIAIYVSLRFEAGFGVAALVATLHDVLMTIALFVFFGGEFNAALIAAILLIIGYSVNDTIVVFDRIREELREHPGRSLADVIHIALNRTLSRTVLTSMTVLLCAISLWAFGAGDVRLYGEVFIYGVITGTFSSIFIASPIYYWWHRGERKGADAADKAPVYTWEAGSSSSN